MYARTLPIWQARRGPHICALSRCVPYTPKCPPVYVVAAVGQRRVRVGQWVPVGNGILLPNSKPKTLISLLSLSPPTPTYKRTQTGKNRREGEGGVKERKKI